jgi:NAD(P)-dependent dehydrogenase (short-subunit alcohol dehydrogenase family)
MPDGDIAARFGLDGKVALVTGGSRGLGRGICLALAAAGADVVITSRDQSACEEVAAQVERLGRRALAYGCHVGRWNELDGLVDAAYEHFGKVDVLVNNAGKSPLYDSLTDISETMFDSVVGLNLKGPFRLASLIGTRMAGSGGGSIINISSVTAIRPDPAALPYAAAKAGLDTMTVGLAQALAPKVRVNAIVPGAFRTDVSKHWSPEVWERVEAAASLGRVGEPDEICGAVLYLASDASSFTTGSLLRVDGGIS